MFRASLAVCAFLLQVTYSTASLNAATINILPLGDSITYGSGSSTGAGYRGPLQSLMSMHGLTGDFLGTQQAGDYSFAGLEFDADHEGYPGAEAASLKTNQLPNHVHASNSLINYLETSNTWENLAAAPDFVLLHIGTNSTGTDPLRTDDPDEVGPAPENSATNQLRRLLAYLADQPLLEQSKILLAKILPKVDDSGGLEAREARYQNSMHYNSLLPGILAEFAASSDSAEQSLASRAVLVDMSAAGSWLIDTNGNGILDSPNPDTGLLTSDGIHPADAGYALMGRTWFQEILSSGGATSLPEPSTAAMLLVAAAGLLVRQRR